MRKGLPWLILVLGLFSWAGMAHTAERAAPEELRESAVVFTECKTIAKQPSAQQIMYVRDFKNKRFGKWQVYDKQKPGDWVSRMTLFISDGRPRLIAFFQTDPGFETAQYTNYCFRKDGTTAYIEEDYRILAGVYRQVLTVIQLNPKGKVLSNTTKLYDIHSRQEITDPSKNRKQPTEIFVNIEELLNKYQVPFKGM